MNTNHTPGPWTVDETWGLIMAGTAEVAACHAGSGGSRREPRGIAQANARLIAAAPDLLAACRSARSWLEVSREHDTQLEELLNELSSALRV